MPWLQSHMDLIDHRKLLRLMSLMQWELPYAIGILHLFWFWCLRQARDGDLRPFTPEEIARGACVPADQAGEFLKAMIKAGFIDKKPYLRVHDWWDHMGAFFKASYKQNPEKWRRIEALYYPERAKEHTNEQSPGMEETGLSLVVDETKSGVGLVVDETNSGRSLVVVSSSTRPEKKREEKTRQQEKTEENTTQENKTEEKKRKHHQHQQQQQKICENEADGEDEAVEITGNIIQQEQKALLKEGVGSLEGEDGIPDFKESNGAASESLLQGKRSVVPSWEEILRLICYRTGREEPLPPNEVTQLLMLLKEHGSHRFYRACTHLHGGVKYVPRFLEKLLAGKSRVLENGGVEVVNWRE